MSSREPGGERRANHLAGQTSPYLLQHVHNPVDWYPWGDEPLERARREDKPIFLSIGYAACHWCHVMERESFESDEIAALLNRQFVAIKVDREERPDLDEIYMNAVQLMTGHGGWPMSVFLTPDRRPFFGGTYFPPEDLHGRIGFRSLLLRVHEAWTSRRDELDRAAGELTQQLSRIAAGPDDGATAAVGPAETSRAAAELAARFDSRWGGFGAAPKFPADGALALLLREHARSGERFSLTMAETTLDRMATGGLYDHVGGGFARYSVDERWLVPHFEKMLYNQALLVPVYVDAWLITGKSLYRRVVEQTLDFVRREMTADCGGFYSSLDADSEGEEGRFYVWSPEQIAQTLGAEDGRLFCDLYDVSPAGNFEGRNIPNLIGGTLAARAVALGLSEDELVARVDPLRGRLLEARARRVRPATDDKILTAWNGLMISACCRAYQALGRARDLRSARRAAEFATGRLLERGRLRVSFREGRAALNGYLDDYAFLARGLIDLYESDFDPRDLELAGDLARTIVSRFEDGERGGFFFTSDDHESLLTRNRSLHDGALPAGAGVAVEVLARLASHLDASDLRDAAERAVGSLGPSVARMPSAFTSTLLGASFVTSPPLQIAIVGEREDEATGELLRVVRSRYRLGPTVQAAAPEAIGDRLPLLAGKRAVSGEPTAWVCRNYACDRPTRDPRELASQLGDD